VCAVSIECSIANIPKKTINIDHTNSISRFVIKNTLKVINNIHLDNVLTKCMYWSLSKRTGKEQSAMNE
jgi:hypothetical protein